VKSVIHRAIKALRPDGKELERLVRAEMDPSRYASFRPITAGPIVAAVGLAIVGVLGALAAPIRLLRILRSG